MHKMIEYVVEDVTSMLSLIDMMRYDGFMFSSVTQDSIRALIRLDNGIISKEDPYKHSVRLVKIQKKNWQPTFARWHSFGMNIVCCEEWKLARTL